MSVCEQLHPQVHRLRVQVQAAVHRGGGAAPAGHPQPEDRTPGPAQPGNDPGRDDPQGGHVAGRPRLVCGAVHQSGAG